MLRLHEFDRIAHRIEQGPIARSLSSYFFLFHGLPICYRSKYYNLDFISPIRVNAAIEAQFNQYSRRTNCAGATTRQRRHCLQSLWQARNRPPPKTFFFFFSNSSGYQRDTRCQNSVPGPSHRRHWERDRSGLTHWPRAWRRDSLTRFYI